MRNKIIALTGAVVFAGLAGMSSAIHAQNPPPVASGDVPTFTKDVAPIFYKNCTSCHRPGDIAPMSLLTYESARPYARSIANAITNKTMPPWHASAPEGTFQNERILTDADRQTLIRWATGGAPKGDVSDLPAAPVYTEGWQLGQPDLVLEMGEDREIPASGTVEYEYFYIPTNFTEPKWVQSIEIKPGNRALVHHVLVRYRAKPTPGVPQITRGVADDSQLPKTPPGERAPRSDLGNMPPRLLATYAPGTNPQVAPAGTAFRLEPGGIFELQMHYTANGKAGTDRTKLGITFSRDPAPREVRATQFFNTRLVLPPGSSNVDVTTNLEFLQDATVWGIFPHTHVRGKRWEYTLTLPDGETKSILSVPRYDFNWQTYYMFSTPLQVPKGSKITSTAWYDNSSANKSNPNPNTEVHWGDQTWEEMQYTGVLVSAAEPRSAAR